MSDGVSASGDSAGGPGVLTLSIWSAVAITVLAAVIGPQAIQDDITLGMDLGTTASCAATCSSSNEVGISMAVPCFPSVVHFPQSAAEATNAALCTSIREREIKMCVNKLHRLVVVGQKAEAARAMDPQNTVYDSKRIIGRSANDPIVLEEDARVPYKIVALREAQKDIGEDEEETERAVFVLGSGLVVSPEVVGALILRHMREEAQQTMWLKSVLGFRFQSATVTVPVEFSEVQRGATELAGLASGLSMVRIIGEPVAAALAYDLGSTSTSEQENRERIVMVFDFGGGTLDVAILAVNVMEEQYLLLGSMGGEHLGGEDVDNALADFVYYELNGFSAESQSQEERDRLRQTVLHEVEEAKKMLGSNDGVLIRGVQISEEDSEKIFGQILDEAMGVVDGALTAVAMAASDIQDVVLVGGSSKLKGMQRRLQQRFGKEKIRSAVDPESAVVYGAARSFSCRPRR